jgi:hypothetical protein
MTLSTVLPCFGMTTDVGMDSLLLFVQTESLIGVPGFVARGRIPTEHAPQITVANHLPL